MRLKRFALKGMIVLAVVIALCLLFSGTLRSMMTPKVRYASVKMGKFENTVELTGKVVFPEEEKITLEVPEGVNVTVSRVLVSAGQQVKKGEKLLTATVVDEEKTLTSLQQEANAASETLETWERKNGDIRLSRNETLWKEAYEASREAEQTERMLRMLLLSLLAPTGVNGVPESLPEDADEATTAAWDTWQKAQSDLTAAREKLSSLSRFAISEDVWSLLEQKRDAEEKREKAEKQMMDIMLLSAQVSQITAPHKGYIASVSIEKGGTVSEDALMTITPEDKDPVIRMDTSNVKQKIQKGTTVTVNSESWGWVETKIVATGMTDSGHPYADAEITQDVIYALGKIEDMMKNNISLRLTTRAQEASCLIPAAAVRGSGDNRYVYVGEQETSALAGTRITVQKVNVKVLAESASVVSVAEDLSRSKVLYLEDRSLTEGGAVMLYEE